MNSKMMIAGATFAAAAMSFTGAQADNPVTPSLTAHWFQVSDGTDPDFNLFSTPTVAPGSGLTNGMVTATGGVNDILPNGELTWWDPAHNSNVSATSGPSTISLPYGSNMFAPGSTGTSNSQLFETAYFTGNFNLSTAGVATFNLGSDDDSFIYVDGLLVGQNPGVHAVTNVTFNTGTLSAGNHSLEVFYADRENTDAYLSLSSSVTVTPGVPEPATWGMMLLGFFGLGSMVRRRATSAASVA
jgi:fibro-slime domain-containing protein